MKEDAQKEGLRMLEELVLDASEPVSYRRLASTLCIHVNLSKVLLKQFCDLHAEDKDLYVSVLVCGSTPDGNARMVICPKSDLEDTKKSFKQVMFEHIYGVSKTRAALEGAALAASAGGFEDYTPTVGTICSPLCTKRSSEEIDKIKINSYKSLSSESKSSNTLKSDSKLSNKQKSSDKPSKNLKNEPSDSNKKNSLLIRDNGVKEDNSLPSTEKPKSISHIEDEKLTTNKNKSKVPEKKDISSFFNRVNGKTSVKPATKSVKEESKASKPVTTSITEAPKATKPSPKVEPKVKTEELEPAKNKNSESELIKDIKSESTVSNNSDNKSKFNDKKMKKGKVEVKKSTSKNNNIIDTKITRKVDTKRKRVLCISDSEDSDEDKNPFEVPPKECKEESDDDIIPATPNADVVKITSAITNPKKRRKIVDKTYISDDGYMVTRKEEVYESCSDDDIEMKENVVQQNVKEPIVVKKTPTVTVAPIKKSKKKISSPQKTKQPSIQSFFMKK